ncbi:MAG: hypothetical protein IPM06_19115 [Rhizobiales bacterium]|jgi:hypothetical protein|nr:hypothetical protein [Hyphomicrobiales bacterium]
MGANKEYNAPVRIGGEDYETVAASQTDQVLGTTGSVGDFLGRLIITASTAATATVSIKDGSGSAIPICPALAAAGVFVVELGIRSTSGAWKVTTGAGATVVAIGKFSV